jgi:tetratricopeptide (TPR) repeat protein
MIIWAALLWAAAASSPGTPAYERANALFVKRNLPASQAAVDEALRLDPRFVPALTLKAKLAMAAKRFDLARPVLEQALAIEPAAAYPRFLYGLQFYLSNELQPALTQFRKARELNPSDARAAQYLGLTMESLGQPMEALAQYEQAAKLGPKSADILLTGARLLLSLNRLQESAQWINRSLQLEPDSRDAHFEKARLLLRTGELAQAAAQGELALHLPPGDTLDSQIHYLLIRAYRDSDPDAAARHAETLR